jgi:hypothetical protein
MWFLGGDRAATGCSTCRRGRTVAHRPGQYIARMHPAPRRWSAHGLAIVLYLGLALLIWSGVWLHHPTTTATCGCGDTSLFTWFMSWPAYALHHGESLFFSDRAFHPYGINLPANTSFLAISLPLTPVTWAFGPVASLNVAATLAPVATALSARALLLRWTTWQPAAFLAGLFYGFSPFVVENLSLQHIDFATLAVPPLLFWCLDELLVRQRGRAWAWGLALGGLCAVQFFLSSEVLVICVVAAVIGTFGLVAAGVVRSPRSVAGRLGHAATGFSAAAGAGLVLLSYPAWYAIAGPRALPAKVFPDIQFFGSAWRSLLLPASSHDRGPNVILETYGYFGSHPLLKGYLGLGMVAVLMIGLAWFHRDRRLWFCGAMLVATEALSLGAAVGPWKLFANLPLVQNIVPERIAVVADLFAALMLGVILDRARNSRLTWPGQSTPEGTGGQADHRSALPRLGTMVAWALATVALLPIALGYRLPFTTVGTTLPVSDVVLTSPFASSGLRAPMTWQAVAAQRWSLVGGWGITPTPPAHPSVRQRAVARATFDLINLSDGFLPLPAGRPDESERLRTAMLDWGVTTVVLPDERNWPASLRGRSVPVAVGTFTAALGVGPVRQAGAWVWNVPRRPGPPMIVREADFIACTTGPSAVADPGRVATCLLAAGRTNPPLAAASALPSRPPTRPPSTPPTRPPSTPPTRPPSTPQSTPRTPLG